MLKSPACDEGRQVSKTTKTAPLVHFEWTLAYQPELQFKAFVPLTLKKKFLKLIRMGKDAQFPTGKVGIHIYNIHAHFDDLIISGDDVEDGGNWDAAKHPEEKAVEPKGKLATSWGKLKTGH